MPLLFSLDASPDTPGQPIAGTNAGDVPLRWSADGRAIFVRRGAYLTDRTARILRVDLETGRAELLEGAHRPPIRRAPASEMS